MSTSNRLNKLCFGGASLSGEGGGYGFGIIKEPELLVEQAYERGLVYFDTAPIYGFGNSERTLGRGVKKIREKIKVISKSGVGWHPSKRVNMSNEPTLTRLMLENSLRDLDSDYIDIYMIHWPDEKVDIRFPLDVLQKAKDEGKIKAIGLCNTNNNDLILAKEVCNVEYVQGLCNLFTNSFEEISEEIKNQKITTMGYGTFDKGILTKSVTLDTQFSCVDARSWAPWWKKSNWKERVGRVEKLELDFPGKVRELALHYSFQEVDISLCGFKTPGHIDDAIKALKQTVDSEACLRATRILRA